MADDGVVQIVVIVQVRFPALPVGAEDKTTLEGNWVFTEGNVTEIPQEAMDAFNDATAELVGCVYEPVALLATQVVAGMNYCILCRATIVVPEAETVYVLAYVYRDTAGVSTLLKVQDVNISLFDGTEMRGE